jgi:di/tricarboxylate transporter
MKNSQNKAFTFGFCCGILSFIALNIYSLSANYGGCLDCYGDFGIPFILGDSNIKFGQFIWSGLIADLIFAIISSFIIGLVFKLVWLKFNSRSASLK